PARTEIRRQHLLDEDPQLNVVGLVDAELATDVLDLLRARYLAGEDVGRIAADPVEQQEHEQDDPEDGGDHLPQPAEDVCVHAQALPKSGLPAGQAPRLTTAMPSRDTVSLFSG